MGPSLKHKANMLRREHILAAALRVFAERGYRRATIRHIAVAAGVADGTIYNAFANKAELMFSLIQPLADRVPRDVSPLLPDDGAPASTELLRERWEAFTPDVIEMLRVVLSEALVDAELRPLVYGRIIAPVLEPLLQASAAHQPAAAAGTLDPAITSRAVVATVIGFAMLRMLGDKDLEHLWPAVPGQLAQLFSAVLPPGRDA